MRTLRSYLLTWALGVLVAVWLALIVFTWATAFRETRQFGDGQMVSVAKLWLTATLDHLEAQASADAPDLQHEYLQDIAVVAWVDGRLVTDTHDLSKSLRESTLPRDGFATLQLEHKGIVDDWRSFSVQVQKNNRTRRVLVLVDLKRRFELGKDIAEHVAESALLVLPLVALLLWWAVRRGLRPLDQLSSEVAALDGFAGQRLDAQQRYLEFSSTVAAINALVDTLQARAQRERDFASDVAHELRTPLAALTLQAAAARREPTTERLTKIEQEALRAGRILLQLLELARAQRATVMGAGAHGTETVVLGELAEKLIASHVPAAHESGHELSLNAPSEPVVLIVQPLLLELALRNLLENALRHTPHGSQVVVTVWKITDERGVSVSDNGKRFHAAQRKAESGGLGLGLRLVERLAEQMGAKLECDQGEPPMSTRYSLRWSEN